jgi:hypothetical protein
VDYCFDVWTVRKVASDDFGQDHWDQNDSIDYRQTQNDDDDDNNNPSIEDLDIDDSIDDGGNQIFDNEKR